jgi:ComF family protein
MESETGVCLYCELDLPRTGYAGQKENAIEKKFWGRLPLHGASSFYFFQKKSKVQHLVHDIKYKGNKKAALITGKWFGAELKASGRWPDVDFLVPVPLHRSKQRKRGFNQSEWIASAIALEMNTAVSTGNLVRIRKSDSQTRKSKEKRFENVHGAFQIKDPETFRNKHIMIVDDVITTGATLESCAMALINNVEGLKLSIVTLATAVN